MSGPDYPDSVWSLYVKTASESVPYLPRAKQQTNTVVIVETGAANVNLQSGDQKQSQKRMNIMKWTQAPLPMKHHIAELLGG